MWKVYRRQTDDGCQVMVIVHMDLCPGELKIIIWPWGQRSRSQECQRQKCYGPNKKILFKKQLCDLDWPWWQRSRSHKGHYGMRHTALWSCTHVLEWSSNHNLIFKFPGLTLTNQITDLFKVSVIPASILAFQKIAYSSQHRFSFCKKLYLLFPPSTP
jgi:hypothetical protein